MIKQVLYKSGLGITFLFVCFCLYCSVFTIAGNKSELSPVVLFLGAFIFLGFILKIYQIIQTFSDKTLTLLRIALYTGFAIGLLYMGFCLKNIPAYDLSSVHREAEYIVRNGAGVDVLYFSKYKNNVGILMILVNAFTLAKRMGVEDFRSVGIVLGSVSIFLSVLFGSLCCYKIKGKYVSFIYLIVSVLSPSYYLFASYYYTDVLSLPFLTGGLFLCLSAFEENNKYRKFGYYALAGSIIAFGMEVRATIGILLIAALVALFFKEKFRILLKSAAVILSGFIIGFALCNVMKAPYEIQDAKNYEFPLTHWVMMGLNDSNKGAYSISDFNYTDSFSTYEEKVEKNMEQIQARAGEMGLSGILSLIKQKTARVWTDGWYAADLHINNLERYSDIYEYIKGSKNIFLRYYLQINNTIIWLSIGVFLIWLLRGKYCKSDSLNILVITLFGAFLFYCIWEAERRYAFSFLPLLLLLVSLNFAEKEKIIIQKLYTYNINHVAKWLAVCAVVGISLFNIKPYAWDNIWQRTYCIDQNNANSSCRMENKDAKIIQTFKTDKIFNRITVGAVVNENEKFLFELWQGENCIAKGKVDSVRQKEYDSIFCEFEEVIPRKHEEYIFILYPAEPLESYETAFKVYSKANYDILKNAEFTTQNTTLAADKEKDSTLCFSVFKSYYEPVFSIGFYLFMVAVIIFIIEWTFKIPENLLSNLE